MWHWCRKTARQRRRLCGLGSLPQSRWASLKKHLRYHQRWGVSASCPEGKLPKLARPVVWSWVRSTSYPSIPLLHIWCTQSCQSMSAMRMSQHKSRPMWRSCQSCVVCLIPPLPEPSQKETNHDQAAKAGYVTGDYEKKVSLGVFRIILTGQSQEISTMNLWQKPSTVLFPF